MLSIENAARRWLGAGRPVALAVVIETWGSAPVPAGGCMVIAAEDTFQGSVSGGCVEADVIAAALDVLMTGTPQVLSFGVKDETAWRAGLACGGKIRIAVFRLTHDLGLSWLDQIARAGQDRKALAMDWNLFDGTFQAFDAETAANGEISAALTTGASRPIAAPDGEHFLHVFAPPPRVLIIGATHIAQHLHALCAAIGYETRVIDPRGAFTSEHRFESNAATTAWPSEGITKGDLDPFTAVVTLTHVGAIDDEALTLALKSPCRYIGALGSRKTHAARVERLRLKGFNDTDIGRIAAPVGLDIGAKTPGEIAVSILAQLIQAFRKPQTSP